MAAREPQRVQQHDPGQRQQATDRTALDRLHPGERASRSPLQPVHPLAGANLQITAIVTGALAVVLGGDVFWSLVGLLIGQLLGGAVMALHAAQAAPGAAADDFQPGAVRRLRRLHPDRPGVPDVPGLHRHRHGAFRPGHRPAHRLSDSAGIFIFAAFIVLVTVLGYRVIHIIGRIASVLGIIAFVYLFSRLMLLSDIGDLLAIRHFSWASFLLAVSLAASWQIAFGPYVADYSRYLPASTSSWKTFLAVGLGSVLGAQASMVLGCSPQPWPTVSSPAARWPTSSAWAAAGPSPRCSTFSIAFGKVTISTLNSYGSFMCIATIISSVRGQLEITRVQRLFFVLAIVGASTLIALLGQHSFLAAFKSFILFLLTFFTPWSAVNLVDYYFITRERYDVPRWPTRRPLRSLEPAGNRRLYPRRAGADAVPGDHAVHRTDGRAPRRRGYLLDHRLAGAGGPLYLVARRKATRQAPARMILPADPGAFEPRTGPETNFQAARPPSIP